MVNIFLILLIALSIGCSTKPYTNFLIEPEIEVDEYSEQSIKTPKLDSRLPATDRVITMRWNDGSTHSEIDIPLSAAGRVIIQHNKKASDSTKAGPKMVLAAPTSSDTVHLQMHNGYIERGLAINSSAPAVSLSQVRISITKAIRSQNYAKGLMIVDSALARYPSHPEFLKAQGSLYLLIGERSKAIESYEKSLEIEDDPAVSRKINELEKMQ